MRRPRVGTGPTRKSWQEKCAANIVTEGLFAGLHLSKTEPRTAIEDRFLDHPFAIGGRLVNPLAGTVHWQGRTTHLRRKELEVLAMLAGADGVIVTRQAFVAVVWSGNDLVGDRGVSDTMSSLRRNLQDDDPNHPLIRTIPRRGYQLAAPVQPVVEQRPMLVPGGEVLHSSGWRLLRKLGDSTRSETWLAEASEYHGELEGSAQQVFRFCRSESELRNLQREVTLLRYINQSLSGHPGFAVIRDWQLDEPPYYLRRDFARFGGLREWTQACGMPRTPPLGMMLALSEALAALHELGVVHRGLGEDCILVDGADEALQFRISALGLSALPDRGKLASLPITALGLTMGAEEAHAQPTSADDVAALGLVFLRLSVGDWQAEPSEDAFGRVNPAALQALIRCCLGPASERPDAGELAEGLRSLLAPDNAADVPASPIELRVVPSGPTGASPVEVVRTRATPETIGRYRLLDRLGEGGMGVVYLAEQRDPYRKVALKIIRSGIDGEQVLSRFEAERQALAMMNHVNVASVYESGLADDGRPYFAMEYIAGEDIKSYCDHHHLSIRARIRLFLQVCDGVLHAHQKGVLHRDIKPGNLMVTSAPNSAGIVKVIDFGLAKSLHGKLASQTLHTSFGAFVGTPVYCSPEHVSGRATGVDTRGDIYSMGVVLYELLVGSTPIASESLQDLEPERVREIVCNSRLPSMREQLQKTSQEKQAQLAEHRAIKLDELPKTLGGDLSWVVGKCLERDPDDRYASVLALKDDLERWLELRPVEARPTSGWYRFRKLVRRNRAMSLLIASASAALVVASTAALFGYLRAEHALEASRLAEAEATSAADFQVKQMQSVDPAAMGVSLRESLVKAVQERGAQRGWDPAAVAQGEQDLARLIEGVNFTDLSLQQLDTHQFEPTLTSITNDFKDQPLLQARLWQSLADSLVKLGRIDAATEPQRLALEQRQRLLGDEHLATLISLRGRGSLQLKMGQHKEAEADLRTAAATMQRILGDHHPETLSSQLRLGEALQVQGRLDEALEHAQATLEASRKALGEDDPTTLSAKLAMGNVLFRRQSYSDAEATYLDALQGYQRVYGFEHPKTWKPMSNLAVLFQITGRYDEAEALLSQVLPAERAQLGEDHEGTLMTQANLSVNLVYQGRLSESEALMRQLVQATQRTSGAEHPRSLNFESNLARVLLEQGKNDEAVAVYRQVVATARRARPGDDRSLDDHLVSLAIALRESGEFDEAAPLFRDLLQSQRRSLGDSHRKTLLTMTELASLLEAQGDLDAAEVLVREALASRRKTLGDDARDTLNSLDQLSQVLRLRGKLDEAVATSEDAIRLASEHPYPGQLPLSLYRIHLARTLMDLRRFDEADGLLDEARIRLSEDPYPPRASVEALAETYADVYLQRHQAQPGLGFDTEAEAWRRKLQAMKETPSVRAAEFLSEGQAGR